MTNTRIPPNCTSWFDGCNTCMVKDGVITGCTKMACKSDTQDQAMSRCLAYSGETPAPSPVTSTIPANCTSWFDGCNTCMVRDGKTTGCTMMACKGDLAQPECRAYAAGTIPVPSPSVVASPKPSEAGVLATFAASNPCGELHYQSYTYTCLGGQKYSDNSLCVNITQAMANARAKCRTGL